MLTGQEEPDLKYGLLCLHVSLYAYIRTQPLPSGQQGRVIDKRSALRRATQSPAGIPASCAAASISGEPTGVWDRVDTLRRCPLCTVLLGWFDASSPVHAARGCIHQGGYPGAARRNSQKHSQTSQHVQSAPRCCEVRECFCGARAFYPMGGDEGAEQRKLRLST